MCEKLLVTALTKLYNFVPDAGIWLNTQRPEWNDANNALVGKGASVITLCHLRRFLVFFDQMLAESELEEVSLNKPVFDLMESQNNIHKLKVLAFYFCLYLESLNTKI